MSDQRNEFRNDSQSLGNFMPTASELADWLLSRGRSAVTTEQAAELLGVQRDQVRVRLHKPVADGSMFSPGRGLWIAIAPKYRTWGAPPAVEFIDTLMTHLNRAYYVGWLSAAEIHGAAHQRPQATQIAVDRPTENRSFGRAHLRFYRQSKAAGLPRQHHNVESGQAWISTPELTAVDLVDRPELGGGVSNVATVLHELAESVPLDPEVLAAVAAGFSTTAVRRLGFLLDLVGADVDTGPLGHRATVQPMGHPALLDPRLPRRGHVDLRWGICVNTDVEPDL